VSWDVLLMLALAAVLLCGQHAVQQIDKYSVTTENVFYTLSIFV
jgi:hypothetical protein